MDYYSKANKVVKLAQISNTHMPVGVHEPNPNENYYAWKQDHLIHLSAGALIANDAGLILTIYLERVDAKYFLPTKTHKPDQTLEQTLAEITKKIGYELEIESYIGTTEGKFPIPGGKDVTKSIVWFRCRVVGEVERDSEDRDADSQILWRSKEELMDIFAKQASVSSDSDYRKVLDRI